MKVKQISLVFWANVLIVLALFTACNEPSHHFRTIDHTHSREQEPDYSSVYYTVFFGAEAIPTAMHEPAIGALIGFYTEAPPRFDGRIIATHEDSLGVQHDAFMHTMLLDDDFPLLWLLECMAEQKLPVFVIGPPETGSPFNHGLLNEVIPAFGQFSVPMLVVFYPLSADTNWNPDYYIAFFRHARVLFAQHAPNAAFVWAVDASMENYMRYYPGDLAVDWVGMTLFIENEDSDIWTSLDEFHRTFQHEKPIMLNVGISHLSNVDRRYRVHEAKAIMDDFYKTIGGNFPRVKLINYLDVNRMNYTGAEGGHDYRIHIDSVLRAAYQESTANFLAARATLDEMDVIPLRSAFAAISENEGQVYLDVRTITDELNQPMPPRTRWKDGSRRVNVETLEGWAVCHEHRHVFKNAK